MPHLPLPDLPPRATDSHKGDHGRVLVVAGSLRYPGAAILASLGAGRMGAGLVELAAPERVAPLVVPAVPFAILRALPCDAEGFVASGCADLVLASAAEADVVVVGPGLGLTDGTVELVRRVVAEVSTPLVLDADGLNALVASGDSDARALLAARGDAGRATVLTPHPGEFARLAGHAAGSSRAERSASAEGLARACGAVVVLKGAGTVTTDGERTRIEDAGNPGMATGGMGDVLAGALGALLARGLEPASAAALAVHRHACAGDAAAAERGQDGLLPMDVAQRLGTPV